MVELIIVILVVGILALIALPKVKEDHLYELVDQTVALIRHTQQLAMQDNPYDPADPLWFKKRWSIQFSNCQEGLNKFGYIGVPYGFTVFKETNPGGTPRPIFAKDPANPSALLYSGYFAEYTHSPTWTTCDFSKFNKKLDIIQKGVATVYTHGFLGKFVDKVSIIGSVNGTALGDVALTTRNCLNTNYMSLTLSFDEFGRPYFPTHSDRPYGGDVIHCGRTSAIASGVGRMFKRFRITLVGRKQYANIYIEGETGFVHVRYHDSPPGGYEYLKWDANGY